MHILFVSSGNSKEGISPIIKNQGNSIASIGHSVSYFTIKGKGIKGYYSSISLLRNYLKNNSFDVIHAHYSLSAIVASLAGSKLLVVSLMGSDVKASSTLNVLIKFFSFFFWKTIIVKSKDMKASLGLDKAIVIPNGVDFQKFKPINRAEALKATGWTDTGKHILFAANPDRKEKNFKLSEDAFNLLDDKTFELHTLVDVPNEYIPNYMNAADVILLTSLWEGSPNVIKEAMACNRPIVTTDVGDVRQLLKHVDGCHIVSSKASDVAKKILDILSNKKNVEGRERLLELGLNDVKIAGDIIRIYEKAINPKLNSIN